MTVNRGGIWPSDYQPSPVSWMRCCLCGLAHQVRDMEQVGHGRWICNEDTASPLCHRRRVEVGAERRPDPEVTP
jgi:hypothetical protein